MRHACNSLWGLWLAIAGSEDGKSLGAKGCGQPLEDEKGNETNSSPEPPERNTALPTSWR